MNRGNVTMTINFATGNAGKVATAQEHLEPFGIQVKHVKLDLIELQADTAEEIAASKAKQAFEQLKQPVIVEDSSFHIEELNGFPGPYIKYMLHTIGIEGILHLSEHLKSRDCHFTGSLAYADADGEVKTFTKTGTTGRLAREAALANEAASWSELWRIFIPAGAPAVLAAAQKMNAASRKHVIGLVMVEPSGLLTNGFGKKRVAAVPLAFMKHLAAYRHRVQRGWWTPMDKEQYFAKGTMFEYRANWWAQDHVFRALCQVLSDKSYPPIELVLSKTSHIHTKDIREGLKGCLSGKHQIKETTGNHDKICQPPSLSEIYTNALV